MNLQLGNVANNASSKNLNLSKPNKLERGFSDTLSSKTKPNLLAKKNSDVKSEKKKTNNNEEFPSGVEAKEPQKTVSVEPKPEQKIHLNDSQSKSEIKSPLIAKTELTEKSLSPDLSESKNIDNEVKEVLLAESSEQDLSALEKNNNELKSFANLMDAAKPTAADTQSKIDLSELNLQPIQSSEDMEMLTQLLEQKNLPEANGLVGKNIATVDKNAEAMNELIFANNEGAFDKVSQMLSESNPGRSHSGFSDGQSDSKNTDLKYDTQLVNSNFQMDPISGKDLTFSQSLDNAVLAKAVDSHMENMQNIIQGAQAKFFEGGGEVNVLMKPEGLGEVNLKIASLNGKISVSMKTENHDSKKILEESAKDIRDALEALNLTVDDVKVESSQDYQKDFNNQQNEYERQQKEYARDFMNQFRDERQSYRDDMGLSNPLRKANAIDTRLDKNTDEQQVKSRDLNRRLHVVA